MEIESVLIEKIRIADRAGANALLETWAQQHGYVRLMDEVVYPLLIQMGEQWRANESYSIAQVYVAAKITEDLMEKIARTEQSQTAQITRKGPVVIGNIEDDFHALGRRMVGIFLRNKGWEVIDLGNDVPPEEFVNKAEEAGARVIGVSAMMLTTTQNIRRLRETLNQRGLSGRIQLAVGGAVFLVCPGLVEEVGGDGTASNALKAPLLFDQLWQQSLKHEVAL